MRNEPIKKGEELFQYIPQRPPFVMVDALLEQGEDFVLSSLSIADTNILVKDGYLQEGGLVENIAQTAALFAGLRFAERGEGVPNGYIAGIKNLQLPKLPSAGTRIHTSIRLTHDIINIQVVEGEVFNEADELLARCELRIFIKGDE